MDIRGKVALVTGGASGLGRGMADRLLADGAEVIVFDLNCDNLEELGQKYGTGLLAVQGDVADETAVKTALDVIMATKGRLDICVHCAGTGGFMGTLLPDGSPHELAHFRRLIDVNLVGTFNVDRFAAAAMAKNAPDAETGERGVIINTASIAGLEAQEGMLAYGASKAGVIGMTLPLTRDLSKHGIRVNAIAPGFFTSGLTAGIQGPFLDYLLTLNEFPQKPGEPAQFASLAAEIIRNVYLNGEVIRLDAGTRAPARLSGWTE